jgi:hypothetical protein
MLTKGLLTISLLVPLVLSASAQAGSTITDKSYWPSEARQTTGMSQGSAASAFAYMPSRLQPTTYPTDASTAWRYQGGPKSH